MVTKDPGNSHPGPQMLHPRSCHTATISGLSWGEGAAGWRCDGRFFFGPRELAFFFLDDMLCPISKDRDPRDQILQYIPRDPWDWYIYLLIYNKNEPFVGKYTSPMDGMGYIPRDPNTSPCQSEDDLAWGVPFSPKRNAKIFRFHETILSFGQPASLP